ncbi:MAG: acyl-CoA desaturase [Bacteroidales bacterium]|nr:acyl-CoA desaturase [Bacteroidales bacterium]
MIKFPNQNRPEFVAELRSEVKKYFDENRISKFGNSSLIVKTIVMMLLYFIPFTLLISGTITYLPLIMLAWLIMGVAVAGIGMGVMHDANHGSFSSNQKVNNWMSKTLFLLGGFPPNWRYQHNTMHHGFTNIDGHDEDIAPTGILRFSPHKPLYKIHKLQHLYAWFFYGLMTISWVTFKDFKQLAGYKREKAKLNTSKSYRQLLVDLIIAKAIYFAAFLILPVIFIPAPWYITVAGFLLMHFVAGFILGIVFQAAHVVPTSEYPLPDESGNVENNWAIHQLLTTSDFAPKSRLLAWYTGGLNFQVEHHLFPNISHVHYKKLSPLVQRTAEKHNLPYYVEKTFPQALRSHTKMLWQLGRA